MAPEAFVSQFGGDLAYYQELAASADCAFLEQAMARGTNLLEDTGQPPYAGYYMAASQRLDAIGCTLE